MSYSGKLSAATFIAEFAAFIYFSYRYIAEDMDDLRVLLSMANLLFLSLYQLSEVITCAFEHHTFGKSFGHVAITTLPSLGLYLTSALGVRTYRLEHLFAVAGATYIIYFIYKPDSVDLVACRGFFVQYRYRDPVTTYYGFYYNGALVMAMIFLGIAASGSLDALYLLIGYAVFTIPTLLQLVQKQINQTMVTSVMCQWAFLLAVILSVYINYLINQL